MKYGISWSEIRDSIIERQHGAFSREHRRFSSLKAVESIIKVLKQNEIVTTKMKDRICPASPNEWRQWLASNHSSCASVWVIFYKVGSAKHNLTWSQAVDEALCFGWIDSTKKTLDEHRYMQYYCQRKPSSTWSKINKDKVKLLIEKGLMKTPGMEVINAAKKNGTWSLMDEIESGIIPADVEIALASVPASKTFFLSLSKSIQKTLLHKVVMAKRPETRAKRIKEIVELAGKGQVPK